MCIIGISVAGSLSAADLNETAADLDESIDEDEISIEEIENNHEDKLSQSEDNEIISANYTPKNSSEIQSTINNASDGDTIILDGYYLINTTVNVNKQLNFVGQNNATIDGNSKVSLFFVSNSLVTFKNITFINGYSMYGSGGAISGKCTVVNCSFISNSVEDNYGGALYCVSAVNCIFIRNSVVDSNWGHGDGGAMYGGSAVNCTFINNTARLYGGAISSGSAVNCSFLGNSARYGGALFRSSAVNCSFIGNSVSNPYDGEASGGAIYGFSCSALNCTFINNTAKKGGAMHSPSGSALNCTFINNTASIDGGAVYQVIVTKSIFINNHADNNGGAIFEGYVSDSFFENNSAKNGGAISGKKVTNCIFDHNVATDFGGAIYNATISSNSKFYNNIAKIGNDTYNVTFYDNGTVIKSFSDLNNAINNNNDSDIFLDCDYIFNSISDLVFKDGIIINRPITIWGNGFTINGDNLARIFNVTVKNVIFKDLILCHGKSDEGAAIYSSKECSCVNCTFIGNIAQSVKMLVGGNGGAVYFWDQGSCVNCTFINNTASGYGGAVYFWHAGSVVNCSFVGTSSSYDYVIYDGYVLDCIFDRYPHGSYHYTSYLNVNNLSVFNDNNAFLVANLYDIRGPLFSKTITFKLNGIEYNVTTDSEGFAHFNIGNYLIEQGSYNVTVSFAGDEINYQVSKNVIVTKTNYNTNLNVNNLSAYIGEGILIASLSDVNGQLYGKTITFNINGVEYNVTTDSDGLAKFNIGNYLKAPGSYDINVSFGGDDFNSPVFAIAHVVINIYNSILDVCDLSVLQGEDGFLIARLSDSRGVLANKTLALTINNVNYYNNTDLEGIVKLNVKDYFINPGKYNVSFSFAGDEYTNPVSSSANVFINTLKANLTLIQDGKYYNNTNLTFKLVNLKTNEAISDALIHAEFSNGQTTSIFTDSEGIACYQIPFEPGTYSVTASVLNIDYSDINTVELNDFIVSNFVGQSDVYQAEDCRILKVRLYDPSTGYVFKNFNVTLSFSTGKIVDVVTNNEGIATYNMPFDMGTYSVNATVLGKYCEFELVTLNNIIINNKENSKVIFSCGDVLEINYLESGSIFAGVEGGSINAEDISILGNHNAQISISSNNIISISGLDVGNYILTVKTTPDASHNAITRSVNIKVNKIESSVTLNNDVTFDYGSFGFTTVDFDGCSISKENIYVVGHPEAVINYEENLITVSNLSAGSYTLIVSSTPDDNHIPVTCNVSVNVNKVDSSIDFNDEIAFDYGGYGSIDVSANGCSFKRDNISVIDHSEAVIRVGNNMITISNLTSGDYTLKVTTTPDENHKSVTRNVPFTVNKLSSFLNFNRALSFIYGGYGFTTIDFYDCSISDDNINVIDHPEALIDYDDKVITVSGLDAGDYILSVTTTPDENYKSVTRILAVNVNKIDSKVTLTKDVSFDYLKSGSTSVVVEGGMIENISVVGHSEANITLVDNEITVSNLTAGNYILSIVTSPDENHNSINHTIGFTVNRIDSSVSFTTDNITFDEGGFGSTNVNVEGGSINESSVVVESHPEAVINVSGNKISVSNLTADNYIMRVSSNPDENHKSAIRSINVIVSKVKTSVSFTNDIIFDYGGFGTTKINVTGGFVLTKDIHVLNNDASITMDNNNVITVSGLDAGNYTLLIVTTPDESHRVSEATINITVNKVASKILFDKVISFDYGSYGSVDINVEGGNVLTANVIGYPYADVRFGSDKISVSNLDAGEYTLNITSLPDNNHYSVSKTVPFKVNKVLSSISFSGNITFDYLGSGSTFIIVTGGSIVANNISVIGQNAIIDFTNNLITISGLNAGNYVLSCNVTPDKNHLSFEGKINITVNRINSIVTANSFSFDYLKSGSTLVIVDGGSVSKNSVEVVGYPGASIDVNNNRITVSNLNPGSYTLRSVKITVNRVNLNIKMDKKTFALKKSTAYSIKVTEAGTNKPVSGIYVTLKVYTGKKYITVNVKTDTNGIASYNTKGLSKGTHNVVASIDHIGYAAKSASSSIKVIKQTKLKFKVKKNIAKDGSSLSITVKKGKKGINGIKINLLVYSGKKYKTITLKTKTKGKYKGVCGWGTNKISVGNHKIVIKPVSIKYSGSKTVKMTLKKSAKKYPNWETKI